MAENNQILDWIYQLDAAQEAQKKAKKDLGIIDIPIGVLAVIGAAVVIACGGTEILAPAAELARNQHDLLVLMAFGLEMIQAAGAAYSCVRPGLPQYARLCQADDEVRKLLGNNAK
jgi:hypothetical protein